ncbi:MAG: hypothetical protein ACI81R_000993 [Bradymonadia bacterium]
MLFIGILAASCGSTLEQAERALQREDFTRTERLASLLQQDGEAESAALLRIDAALVQGDSEQAREELRAWLGPEASAAMLQRSWGVSLSEGDASAAASAFRALIVAGLVPARGIPEALHVGVAIALIASDPERVAAFFRYAPEANNEGTRAALQPRVDLALYAMLRTSQPHNSLRNIAAWERVLGTNNLLTKHRVAAMLESRAGRDGVGALENFVGDDNALLDALAVEFRVRGANRAAEYAFVLLATREPEREVGALLDAAAAAYHASGAEVARQYLRDAWAASRQDVNVAESALTIADARDSDDFVYAFSEQALQHVTCRDEPEAVLRMQARLAQIDVDALAIPAAELRFEDMLDDGCSAADVARTAALLFANANDPRRSESFFWRAFEAGARDAELLTVILDIAEREAPPEIANSILDAYIRSATFADWTDAMLRDLQRRLAMSADPAQNARGRELLSAGFDARPESGYLANALAAGAEPNMRDDVFARYVDASEDRLSARARVAQWRVSGGDVSDGVLVYLAALRDSPGASEHDAPFVYRGSTSTRETAQLLLLDVWLARDDAARALERGLEFASDNAERFEVLWSHRGLRGALSSTQQLQLTSAALSAGWDDASVYVARGRALLDVGRPHEATTAFIAGVAQDVARRVEVIDALIGAQLIPAAWRVAEQTRPDGTRFDDQAARVLRHVIQSRQSFGDSLALGLFGGPHTPRVLAALNRLQQMINAAGVDSLSTAQVEEFLVTLNNVPSEFRDTDLHVALLERLLHIAEPVYSRVVLLCQLARLRGWSEADVSALRQELRRATRAELQQLRNESWAPDRLEISHLIGREVLRRPSDDARSYAVDVGGYINEITQAYEANPTPRGARVLAEFTREFALGDALLLLRDTTANAPQLAGRVSPETACLLSMSAYRGLWSTGEGLELEPLVALQVSRCPSFRFSDAVAVLGLRHPNGVPADTALALVAQAGTQTWSQASMTFLQRDHWEAAGAMAERWLDDSPNDPEALSVIVQTRLGNADVSGAERAALALVDLSTQSDSAVQDLEFFSRMAADTFDKAGRTAFARQLLRRIARHPSSTDQARAQYVELALRLGDRQPLDELLSVNPRRGTPAMSTFASLLVRQGVTDELLRWASANLVTLSAADASAAWADTPFVAPFYREEHQPVVAALFQRSLRLAADAPEARLFDAEQLGVLGLAAASDAASRQASAAGSVTLHSVLLAEDADASRMAIAYLHGATPRLDTDTALSRLVAELLLQRTPAEVVQWLDGLLEEAPAQLGATATAIRDLQLQLQLASGTADAATILRASPDVLARSGRVTEAHSAADPIFDAAMLQRTGGTRARPVSLADCVALQDIHAIETCASNVGETNVQRGDSMFAGLLWLTVPDWPIRLERGARSSAIAGREGGAILSLGGTRGDWPVDGYLALSDTVFAERLLDDISASRSPSADLVWVRQQMHPEMSPESQRVLNELTEARAPLDLLARVDRWWSTGSDLSELLSTIGCDSGGVETMLLYSQERQRFDFFEELATEASRCAKLTWRSHTERARVRAARGDARWLVSARAALRDAPEPESIASYLLDSLPADPALAAGLLEFANERLLAGDAPARIYAMRAAAFASTGDVDAALGALRRLSTAGALPPDGWIRAINALVRAGFYDEARNSTRHLDRYRGNAASYASGLSGFSRVGLSVAGLASAPETALEYLAEEAPGVLAVPGVSMRDATIASLYDAAGQHAVAWAIFEAILAADPQNALVRNNYAYSLAISGERLTEAEYHVRLSLVADRSSPRSYKLDTLAWVLHRAGRDREALTWIRMAIRAAGPSYTRENPDAAVYFAHLDAIEAAVAADAVELGTDEDRRRRGQRRRSE